MAYKLAVFEYFFCISIPVYYTSVLSLHSAKCGLYKCHTKQYCKTSPLLLYTTTPPEIH